MKFIKNKPCDLFTLNPFSHGEIVFKKYIYSSVDGYDTSFIFSQDYDLWLILKIKSHQVLYREDGVRNNIHHLALYKNNNSNNISFNKFSPYKISLIKLFQLKLANSKIIFNELLNDR